MIGKNIKKAKKRGEWDNDTNRKRLWLSMFPFIVITIFFGWAIMYPFYQISLTEDPGEIIFWAAIVVVFLNQFIWFIPRPPIKKKVKK